MGPFRTVPMTSKQETIYPILQQNTNDPIYTEISIQDIGWALIVTYLRLRYLQARFEPEVASHVSYTFSSTSISLQSSTSISLL